MKLPPCFLTGRVPPSFLGHTPIWLMGIPHPRSEWDTPIQVRSQVRTGGITGVLPHPEWGWGTLHPELGWGYPCPDLGWGALQPDLGWGYTPTWDPTWMGEGVPNWTAQRYASCVHAGGISCCNQKYYLNLLPLFWKSRSKVPPRHRKQRGPLVNVDSCISNRSEFRNSLNSLNSCSIGETLNYLLINVYIGINSPQSTVFPCCWVYLDRCQLQLNVTLPTGRLIKNLSLLLRSNWSSNHAACRLGGRYLKSNKECYLHFVKHFSKTRFLFSDPIIW